MYSDVFSEGIPAYWSGYFSTRPFMKQLSRELEANLRAAEILFTVGYQTSKVRSYINSILYAVKFQFTNSNALIYISFLHFLDE